MQPAIEDWDGAYANHAAVGGAERYFEAWARESEAFRASARDSREIAYGGGPRERLDLFAPLGAPAGLVVYFHGGYWKAFDKSGSSWLAGGPTARGWAMAIPSYPLCPEARLSGIVRSAAAAVCAAADATPGPIVLAGHSAGGPLAARLACADGLLPEPVRTRVLRVVGISGVYDLRPLLRTEMNATLRLDPEEAAAESPALRAPTPGTALMAWVGAAELPEFRRQSALIANVWRGLGASTGVFEAPRRNHFDVIAPLAEADSPLTDIVVGAHRGA
jgi:acetyl esterase/lipase